MKDNYKLSKRERNHHVSSYTPYWKNFKKDGLLFEELVEELLHLHYPGKTFKRTKKTHDGSRDFQLAIPAINNQSMDIWFECKFHKEELPIHDVSMTLIMAYIEDVKQIVFFSYSPVNREFCKYITRFQERSQIPVILYDDMALEALIFRHWAELDTAKFFPAYKGLIQTDADTSAISAYCDVYRNGVKINCRKAKNQLPVFRFNDEITIRVTLVNHGSGQEAEVILRLNKRDMDSFFSYDEALINSGYCTKLVIPHNAVGSYTLHLRLKRFADNIRLPGIQVTHNLMKKGSAPRRAAWTMACRNSSDRRCLF